MTIGDGPSQDAPAHRRGVTLRARPPRRRAAPRAARPARARRALGGGADRRGLGHRRRRPERDRPGRGGARPPRERGRAGAGIGRGARRRSRVSARRRRRGSPPPSSWGGAPSRTGRSGAGRSARRGTSRTGCVVEMGRLEREELRVLSLNAKNVVQRVSHVYVGNVSASLVRVGELFRDAVRLDASGRGPGPQPPERRPDAVARRPAPHRRGDRRRAACSTWTCWTTSSSATTRGSRSATAASPSTGRGCRRATAPERERTGAVAVRHLWTPPPS